MIISCFTLFLKIAMEEETTDGSFPYGFKQRAMCLYGQARRRRIGAWAPCFCNHSMTSIERILTSVRGLSRLSVSTAEILSTTSMPAVTVPNTGCAEGVLGSSLSR